MMGYEPNTIRHVVSSGDGPSGISALLMIFQSNYLTRCYTTRAGFAEANISVGSTLKLTLLVMGHTKTATLKYKMHQS